MATLGFLSTHSRQRIQLGCYVKFRSCRKESSFSLNLRSRLYNPTYMYVLPTHISLGTRRLGVLIVYLVGTEGYSAHSKPSLQHPGLRGAMSFYLLFLKPLFRGALLMYFSYVRIMLWLPHTTDLRSHAITDLQVLILEKTRRIIRLACSPYYFQPSSQRRRLHYRYQFSVSSLFELR